MKTYYLRTRSTLILFALFFALTIIPICPGICSQAYADDSWKEVMADICSKTDDAMTFSIDELKAMIEKLDKLKAVIETLEETPRKVNLRRLEMCRNLFAFVLETKEAEAQQKK